MRIKRKVQRLSIWLTYHFSCLHSHEHSMERFRSKYQLQEEIGRGGFGVVYRGFRIEDGVPVAVKFIAHKYVREWTRHSNDAIAAEGSVASRTKVTNQLKRHKYGRLVPAEMSYLHECADLAGVVNLIDWFASPKGFLMVMERPNNCMDLFDVISVYGRLDEEIARRIFEQIVLTVVELLHKHSIVHRDIKDENIIVDMETGTIRLVDFGAADYLEMARFKDFQGTKSYCPPEWFKRNCYLPLESTVWSLGVLLYIMLTGNNPFRNEIQICVGRPKFPDYVSLESQDLIKQCLNPSPERRLLLEEILKHKFFRPSAVSEKRSTSGSADTNVDSGRGSASSSFRRHALGNSLRPFHALLHRRSMRRRRRRDCDNKLTLSDEFESDSNSETECSYRQSMNIELKDQSGPITVPQHVIDAAAKKKLCRQETNENSVYFTMDELDENNYKGIIPQRMQESSSGFETAAEEPDEWPTSQCGSLTESYKSYQNPISQLRRRQLLQIHDQKRIDTCPQLIAGISQSSYKSAVSQIVLRQQDDASAVSPHFSSSSGAGTSEDDDENEAKNKGDLAMASNLAVNNFPMSNRDEKEAADQSSTNLYYPPLEEDALQAGLCSQPPADFWSANDFDNGIADETLKNDMSNSVDATITINEEENNASANDVAVVADNAVAPYECDMLGSKTVLGSERDSIAPTLPDASVFAIATHSAMLDSSATLSLVFTPDLLVKAPIDITPEIPMQNHSAKSSILSSPMQRRPQCRLSRRLRDATRHTSSIVDSRSTSSDSIIFDCMEKSERREHSVPCVVERGIQLTSINFSASTQGTTKTPRKVSEVTQTDNRYRRRCRGSIKQSRLQKYSGQLVSVHALDKLMCQPHDINCPDISCQRI